ncbi:MAG: type II toxin-antitoxin system RelE family toxin [Holosporales bacterium]|jgi:mRNA-degrading endonuclease RelE of RelBE toxin-antitoxin system
MVEFTVTYGQSFAKALKKMHSDKVVAAKAALEMFFANRHHPSLNFEAIINKPHFYSIRVDRKIRIALRIVWGDHERIVSVEVIDIGNHDDIYRRR